MIRAALVASVAMIAVAQPASAQETVLTAQQPVTAQPGNFISLPANTPVIVRMNEELTTRRNEEGDTFYMTVTNDIMQDGYVIIPAGSRAIGTITWLTRRGAFGKSGKMDISITAIEVGSARIPVVGTFRQEGEGNTVATVATVVVAGVFGAFVTGKSGVIPAGRELTVHTRDAMRVALPEGATPRATMTATLPTPVAPVVAAAPAPSAETVPAQPPAQDATAAPTPPAG